ncbi:YidC/Oxa1 family membrane protein insertase [Glaciihabitans tibetensis]|uniref:Membrane protein insertase YidC n=1 Tax=Glaciihabitans tibetensis TaxID=1266600 RepID=A0A2T0VIG6_9MICO|nr:membrane protein insertase YidC [Glaciihabitans tibetensis]PRY70026.1 YidC/Oxa1 family membrane protein insertase [Glaciihabitans tibetensis]
MDLYSFTPIAAVLDAAYSFLSALVSLLQPVAGASSAAAAIVLLTVLVRLALIPVGISQVRAERTRRRLAPALRELQRRYSADRPQLQRKTLELYSREKASPLAGCLPLLFQAPVLSTVYGLFVLGSINGHDNALLDATVGGVPLGSTLAGAVGAGLTWQEAAVYVVLLAVLVTVAAFARRTALAQAQLDAPGQAAAPSGPAAPSAPSAARSARARQQAPSGGTPQLSPGVAAMLSWAPFITAIVAIFVPLAAAIYLAVSTTWTLVERAILRARLS